MKQEGIIANWRLDDYTVESIGSITDDLILKARDYYDKVGNSSSVSYEAVVKPLLDVECMLMNETAPLDAIQNVSTKKELREASVASDKKLNAFYVEMSMRKDVFDKVTEFQSSPDFQTLSPELQRYVNKCATVGRRNGLHLDQKLRDEVKAVKTEMSELATQFGSNLNEDTTFLWFSPEELAGVPQDLVDSFEKDAEGKKCKVTLKYPHFFPVTRKCRVPETRLRIETAYQSRCLKENTEILEKLVTLRQKQAELLGYKNHAHYTLELRMAKSPEVVKDFLGNLAAKMQPIWQQERQELLKLKEEECKKYGYDFDGKLNLWDIRYYTNQVEETRYAVDKEKLKEYFPMEKVTEGLLEIYQQLLGLTFTECKDFDTWHDEVKLFKVEDAETKEAYGYFYLDLHPRDGKFGHAAVSSLQPSCLGPDGKRQLSVCVMMANFSKSTESKPALLDHDEVEVYFHEFGHVMHNICSVTETPRFASLQVERDFVEAPSQMLENWVWEEASLRKMSGHYRDGSPIPSDLLAKLMASRTANAGSFNLRQIILGTFDQRIHTRGQADTAQIFADTYQEILGVSTIPNTSMPATFGHMCGYDSQYYGYLWSEVYSFDMFESKFKKEGLLNRQVGKEYRDNILKPGGSLDAIDMLRNFLGREPNDQAFLRSKGLLSSS